MRFQLAELKAYTSPQRNSARSTSTAVGWTNRRAERNQQTAFGLNDRRAQQIRRGGEVDRCELTKTLRDRGRCNRGGLESNASCRSRRDVRGQSIVCAFCCAGCLSGRRSIPLPSPAHRAGLTSTRITEGQRPGRLPRSIPSIPFVDLDAVVLTHASVFVLERHLRVVFDLIANDLFPLQL
jgi:hypothetical protein